MIRIFTFINLLLSVVACANATEIVLVTVRDSEFRVIKTLTSATELAAFSELWSKKRQEASMEPFRNLDSYLYKIDIELTPKRGDRWLYDPAGVTQVLTKTIVPRYHIDSPERFNALLGIEAK
jgi:hypothetical protein